MYFIRNSLKKTFFRRILRIWPPWIIKNICAVLAFLQWPRNFRMNYYNIFLFAVRDGGKRKQSVKDKWVSWSLLITHNTYIQYFYMVNRTFFTIFLRNEFYAVDIFFFIFLVEVIRFGFIIRLSFSIFSSQRFLCGDAHAKNGKSLNASRKINAYYLCMYRISGKGLPIMKKTEWKHLMRTIFYSTEYFIFICNVCRGFIYVHLFAEPIHNLFHTQKST